MTYPKRSFQTWRLTLPNVSTSVTVSLISRHFSSKFTRFGFNDIVAAWWFVRSYLYRRHYEHETMFGYLLLCGRNKKNIIKILFQKTLSLIVIWPSSLSFEAIFVPAIAKPHRHKQHTSKHTKQSRSRMLIRFGQTTTKQSHPTQVHLFQNSF